MDTERPCEDFRKVVEEIRDLLQERTCFDPAFIRLPTSGEKCQRTGLSRAAMNSVILPTQENGFQLPVKSFVLRRAGAKAGIRLIDYSSLVGFIRAHESTVDLVAQPAAEAPLLPQLATHPASSETATH